MKPDEANQGSSTAVIVGAVLGGMLLLILLGGLVLGGFAMFSFRTVAQQERIIAVERLQAEQAKHAAVAAQREEPATALDEGGGQVAVPREELNAASELTDESPIKPGMMLFGRRETTWYRVHVVEVGQNDEVLVRFPDSSDPEPVARDQLRLPAQTRAEAS